jgi:hypothetical protein
LGVSVSAFALASVLNGVLGATVRTASLFGGFWPLPRLRLLVRCGAAFGCVTQASSIARPVYIKIVLLLKILCLGLSIFGLNQTTLNLIKFI